MKWGLDSRILLALGVTGMIWASAFAAIRTALEDYMPGHLALLRFAVASAVLVVHAAATKTRIPPAWLRRRSGAYL